VKGKNKALKGKLDPERFKHEMTRHIINDVLKKDMTKKKCAEKYKTYLEFVKELHKKIKQ
jgi:hypothetical protein